MEINKLFNTSTKESLGRTKEKTILLKSLLTILNPKEYYVIYHNMISENMKDQAQIAKELEITQQGVSYIKQKALEKINSEELLEIQRKISEIYEPNSKTTSNLIPLEPKLRFALYHLKQVLPTLQYTIIYTNIYGSENNNTFYYQEKLIEQVLTEENINKIYCLYRNNLTIEEILKLNIMPVAENKENNGLKTLPIIKKYLQMEKQGEKEIIRQIQAGNNSLRESFIMDNANIVRKLIKKCNVSETFTEDLLQEGLIYMLEEIDNYDSEKDTRFSTYIYQGLYGRLLRESNKLVSDLTIPSPVNDSRTKYSKLYASKQHLNPSFEEIAKDMNLSEEQANNLKIALSLTCVSINDMLSNKEEESDENSTRLEEIISVRNQESLEDKVVEKQMVENVHTMLENISIKEREKEIICLLNGVGVDRCYSSYEIAEMYHITGTRVRQIRDKAYEKLRNNKEVQKLANYIGPSQHTPVKTKHL